MQTKPKKRFAIQLYVRDRLQDVYYKDTFEEAQKVKKDWESQSKDWHVSPPPNGYFSAQILDLKEKENEVNQYKYLEDAVKIGEEAIEESDASEKAKELGLVHRGFGKYSKDEKGKATHKTVDGKLVRFSDPGTEQDKPKGEHGGKTEKEKEEEKRHVKKVKTGLTNVKRVRSEKGKAAYSFKYNGKSNTMVFTKGEYQLMAKKHINPSRIILARIEKAQEKKKAPQKGKQEKKLEKRREYQQKKKELGTQFQQKKTDNEKKPQQ